jgi:uncharacterized membrane protein YkoI
MKKQLFLIGCLFIALTFTACGEDKPMNENSGNGNSNSQTGVTSMVSNVMSDVTSGMDNGVIDGNDDAANGNGTVNNNTASMGGSLSSTVESAADKLTNGMTDANAKITEEKAKEIALNHAKLKQDGVSRMTVKMDHDDGQMVYEVDFYADGVEYDYEIDANSGEIISSDKDKD